MEARSERRFSTFIRSLIFNLVLLQGIGSMCVDPTLPSSTGDIITGNVGQLDVTNLINYSITMKLNNHKYRGKLIVWCWEKITEWIRTYSGRIVCHTSILYSEEARDYSSSGGHKPIGIIMQNYPLSEPYVELKLINQFMGYSMEVVDTSIVMKTIRPGTYLNIHHTGKIPNFVKTVEKYSIADALNIPETSFDDNNICREVMTYNGCAVPTRAQLDLLFCDDLLWMLRADERALRDRLAFNRSGRTIYYYHIGSLWEDEFIIIRAERYLLNKSKVALIVLSEGCTSIEERYQGLCQQENRYIVTKKEGKDLTRSQCALETFRKVDPGACQRFIDMCENHRSSIESYMTMVNFEWIDDDADYFCRDLMIPKDTVARPNVRALFFQ